MVWMSKLQREIALSTTEAEINTLSRCCCKLFPVTDISMEVGNAVGLPTEELTFMHVSSHEENSGVLILAEKFSSIHTKELLRNTNCVV